MHASRCLGWPPCESEVYDSGFTPLGYSLISGAFCEFYVGRPGMIARINQALDTRSQDFESLLLSPQ